MSLRSRFSELDTVGKLVVAAVVFGAIGVLVIGGVFGTAVAGTFLLSSGDSVSSSPPAVTESTTSPEPTASPESTATPTSTESSDEVVESAPSVSFQYSVSDGRATVEHAAGDSIPADQVRVVAGDTEQTWDSLATGDDTVEQGDSVTFDVSTGQTVEVVFVAPDDETILLRFTA